MKLLKLGQTILLNVAAAVLIVGILTVARIIPTGAFVLTTNGLLRMTDTLLLFSIANGVLIIVSKHKEQLKTELESEENERNIDR
jgi:hypothetical protein